MSVPAGRRLTKMPRRLQGWAALPQGESSAARSRETGGTIGCAVLELPGGVKIRFRDQPAAFVAACAVEAGLRSSSSLASQERSTASQASSAPTAASRRRLRRQKSLRRRQEAAAAAAAPASSAPQSSSVSSAPSEALSARTSIESEPSASCARADKTVSGGPMDVDGQREAAMAAPAALASLDQPSRTAGVAASAEKAAAPAAPSSVSLRVAAAAPSCATPQEAPWIVVKKNGAVEAAMTQERHAGVAACSQCGVSKGYDMAVECGPLLHCLKCPWCPKMFKGPEFVIEHVMKKHVQETMLPSGKWESCLKI